MRVATYADGLDDVIAVGLRSGDVLPGSPGTITMGPLKIISEDNPAAREFYGAAWVMVRPDQFVAWTADAAPDEVAGVLRRAVGSAR